MKKMKKEGILRLAVLMFILISLFCFYESKNIKSKTSVAYTEHGGVKYKVYLKDKSYYNKDYLDENMKYIAKIIDYIDVDFNYNANYNKKDKYTINKKVVGDFKIVDVDNPDKVIYTKQDVYAVNTSTKDDVNITDNYKINYQKYNELANNFKSSYGISANCKLIVSYYIDYTNESKELKQNKVMTIEIPLSEQMITLTKSNDINNTLTYVDKTTEAPVNKSFFVACIIFGAAAFVSLIMLLIEMKKRMKTESKYEKFIKKTLKQYDSYITVAKDGNYDAKKNVVSIDSFKELLDVRNNVDKTIIFVKVNEDVSKFMIIDDEVYQYVAKREEMDK